MTDYTELKRLAEASLGEWYEFGELRCEDRSGYINGLHHEDEYFIAAANPAAVLALIAENEAMARMLQRFVDGEHDQNENQAERHMYFTEAQSLLALVSGELEAHTIVPDSAIKAIHAERDQLRAEVAGLRTGYEAYERLNAELKQKVANLEVCQTASLGMSGIIKCVAGELGFDAAGEDSAQDYLIGLVRKASELKAENEALRLALESCADELEGQVVQCYHGQPIEDMHPVVRRSYDRDMCCVAEARAAMGKGEQS